MPWDNLFWLLALLTAVLAFGQLWFRFVETLLERAKRLLFRHKKPPVWHTLPGEEDENNRHQ